MLFDKDRQWRYTMIARQRRDPSSVFEGEDALVAEAMDLHPELDEIWEQGDRSALPQEINGAIVNPFIHTALHVAIEKQLREKSPPDTQRTLSILVEKGVDRHEAVHRIAEVYAHLYFTTFRRGQSFEELSYIELLRQLAELHEQES